MCTYTAGCERVSPTARCSSCSGRIQQQSMPEKSLSRLRHPSALAMRCVMPSRVRLAQQEPRNREIVAAVHRYKSALFCLRTHSSRKVGARVQQKSSREHLLDESLRSNRGQIIIIVHLDRVVQTERTNWTFIVPVVVWVMEYDRPVVTRLSEGQRKSVAKLEEGISRRPYVFQWARN